MDFLLLPDFFAMLLLVSVLLMVRGRRGRDDMRLWIAGLLFILLECAARILYSVHTSLLVHRAAHAVALDAYLLAGIVFLASASAALRRMARRTVFVWVNVAPMVALLTIYALDNRNPALYYVLIGAGCLGGLAACALLRRTWPFYVAVLSLWAPMLLSVALGQYRFAIYFSLFLVYILCALSFMRSLPSGSRGKIAVVLGFVTWSLCFLTHPWVAHHHPEWGDFANEVWNMQKFVITVGLLLVMLERQVRSNEWLALHDELTGLPNRRLFDDRLQNALARADRDSQRVAIFNVDLDGFKQINDTLGHDAGDILLRGIATNLQTAARKTDTLARLGGDEFTLIAIDLGDDPAKGTGHPVFLPQTERIFAALLQAVELPVSLGARYDHQVAQVSASIGVAIFPDDGRETQALLRLADQRMYAQKAERVRLHKSGTRPTLHLRQA